MHEYSLALDIMSTLKNKYPTEIDFLKSINLKVGQFAGVVLDSLDFCLHTVLESEDMGDVKVIIDQEEAIAECICGEQYNLSDILDNCPKCKSYDRKLISGRDIFINSIEIEDKGGQN